MPQNPYEVPNFSSLLQPTHDVIDLEQNHIKNPNSTVDHMYFDGHLKRNLTEL